MRTLSTVVAIALVASACAPRGADRALTSPTERACDAIPYPERLPDAANLVDVTELRAGVLDLWEAMNLDPAHVLLTMGYDEEGLNIRREVMEHTTEPVAADSVQRLVFAAREELPEADREWTVRLRVEVDDHVSFQTERSVYCPPRPRDGDMERAMRSIQFRAPRMERGVRVRTVRVETTIDPSGRVQAAQVRALPIDTRTQQQILDHLRGFFFDPARLDGVPTWGTIEIPVRVRGV